jgi:hypothetical protein
MKINKNHIKTNVLYGKYLLNILHDSNYYCINNFNIKPNYFKNFLGEG